MPTLQECIEAWNEQADEHNQWSELDADERCNWCLHFANTQFKELVSKAFLDLINEE